MCIMAALAVQAYSVYIVSHVLAGAPIPNGILFGSLLGFIGILAGVKYSDVRRETCYKSSESDANVVPTEAIEYRE